MMTIRHRNYSSWMATPWISQWVYPMTGLPCCVLVVALRGTLSFATPPGDAPGGSSIETTGLVEDPTGDEETTHFAGGDKDTQDIPLWDIVTQDDTPKDDIEHSFAAAYRNSDGDLIVYFGDDRFAQAGDASHGFWFFKNEITANLDTGKFVGEHADGDILVTTEFIQGGKKIRINLFRWETQPAGNDPNLEEVFSAEADVSGVGFCNVAQGTIPADVVCGITNEGLVASPWPYESSSAAADVFPPGAFFEMGVNITAITGESCFLSFMASSRSSGSETATIKDFTRPANFPLCAIEVGKACDGTPVVTPDGTHLETTFDVPITATGALHNVTLAEVPQPALNTQGKTGESCRITAIESKAGAVPAFTPDPLTGFTLNGTTPKEVYTSLTDTFATVTVKCVTQGRNPFIDKVAVTAKSSASLTTPDLFDDHETADPEETCDVGNPDVSVDKCCKSVLIDPDNFTPTVCVAILLTNNKGAPPEALVNLKVVDSVLGTVLTGGTLDIGEKLLLKGPALCYTPTDGADQTGDPVDPNLPITFTDELTEVSGTGAASGRNFSVATTLLPSATCPLCGPQDCDFDPNPLPGQPNALSESASTKAAGTNTLEVANGLGSGSYVAGDLVTVTADPPPPGKKFVGWSGDKEILANPFISPTTATAVSKNVKIKANYADK